MGGLIGDVGSESESGFLQIDFQFLMSAMATLFMMVGKFKGLLLCSSVLEGSNVFQLADSHL